MMRLAFVGLGAMGQAMAGSLLAAGHELAVYNRTPERAESLRARGARVASTPAEAARGAEVVVSMLSDDAAVDGVTFGSEGLLASLSPGAVHVSSSTLSVAFADRLADAHAAAKVGYVAAPVFGRPEAASARKLWLLAAGRSTDIERCLPVLEALGRGVTRLGDKASAANVVKLAGNFVIASMLETLGEAFALTRKAGVEPAAFLDVFVKVFGQGSPIFENYAAVVAKGGTEPGFKVSLALKDMRFALAAGESLHVPLPIASLLRDSFLTALAHGAGDQDWSVIAKLAAERAGL
jgi:3-hydroxyisobutyrate dehydrogenase-like beta-hydroxyacid dehydrogenase